MYQDQVKLFDPKKWSWPIHLIGAGGINNEVAIHLAKMGVHTIHVWDDDELEPHNLPTEVAYSHHYIGKPKVYAMVETLDFLFDGWINKKKDGSTAHYLFNDGLEFITHQERVTAKTKLEGVVICGVDSMSSRAEIWQAVQANATHIPLFIDGRSAGVETLILALSPTNYHECEKYQTWLYSDNAALKAPCGARNIAYVSAYMAYAFCKIITLYANAKPIEFCTSSPHLFEGREA